MRGSRRLFHHCGRPAAEQTLSNYKKAESQHIRRLPAFSVYLLHYLFSLLLRSAASLSASLFRSSRAEPLHAEHEPPHPPPVQPAQPPFFASPTMDLSAHTAHAASMRITTIFPNINITSRKTSVGPLPFNYHLLNHVCLSLYARRARILSDIQVRLF